MKYKILTPARIHCGLINLSGLMHRIDGGLGFCLSKPYWDIEIEFANKFTYEGIEIEEEQFKVIKETIYNFESYLTGKSVKIRCNSKIDSHIGLGSKTSLSLSIAALISKLLKLDLTVEDLAIITKRGGTSGVGVNLFSEGGIVFDIGRSFPNVKGDFTPSSSSKFPPPQKLLTLKSESLKIVHFRFSDKGIYGAQEKQLFSDNCPLPHEETKDIACHLFFEIIPGLLENDNNSLQNGLMAIQNLGLKRIEWENQSEIEQDFYSYWVKNNRESALCLSSMGPTLCYIGNEYKKALDIIEKYHLKPKHLIISDINNHGTKIIEI